jgi:hypothetical protein
VKSTPALRPTLRPSRIAAGCVAAATVATAVLIALLPGEAVSRGAAVVVVAIGGIRALRISRRSIEAIEVTADRRATLIDRSGRRSDGVVQAESYVGASLTTLVWRPDGARWSRAIAIWPDMLAADEFRRLRVLLRHGEFRASSERT